MLKAQNPYGIFAVGGAFAPAQEKKKSYFTAFSPMRGAFMPTQEKKSLIFLWN